MKSKFRSEFWRAQVRQAAEFSGTASEFCRQNDLNLQAFYSWRKRFKAEAKIAPSAASPFVAVEVLPDRSRLPDPRWLAELIHYLARGGQG